MNTATIWLKDEINCVVMGLSEEHNEYFHNKFAYHAKNYFFNPKYKLGIWDGKIRFYSRTGVTYLYLVKTILKKLRRWGYEIKLKDDRKAVYVEPPIVDEKIFADILNEHGDPYLLRWYQVAALNSVIPNGGGIMIAGTGAGKAQDLNSKILTNQGWKRMGDIRLGDNVITPSGDIAPVSGIFPQGKKDVYEITFHDGSKARCCREHLWTVRKPKKLWRADTITDTIPTSEIINFIELKKSGTRHMPGNISIPLTDAIQQSTKEYSIDPYLIGCLIGDGGLTGPTPIISSIDQPLINDIKSIVERDHKLLVSKVDNVSHRLCNPTRSNQVKTDLKESLKILDLWDKKSHEKFIPTSYIEGDINQRFALLQGLMDTDGTVDVTGKSISYTTVNNQLAKQVQQLVWSLGGICTITNRIPNYQYNGEIKQGQKAYTCFMTLPDPSNVFRLQRKRELCTPHAHGRVELTRRIKNVEKISNELTQCIMIDHPDHLYITDDYVVTHNTIMSATIAKLYGEFGLRVITIVPSTSLVVQSSTDFKMWNIDCGQYGGDTKELDHRHLVTTWQSLQNVPTILKKFDVVVVDECHGAKANVLAKLLKEHGSHIGYRFGMTGTMPDDELDNLQVRLTLGDVEYEIPAHTLIDEGFLSSININVVQLDEEFEDDYFPDYASESSYLRSSKARSDWMGDFIHQKSQIGEGNTLVLVSSVPVGKKLANQHENWHFVYGKDKTKARKQIYDLFKSESNLVVITTVQVAGTGLSIDRIFNLVLIDIGKSFVRVIQAIGRGLRKNSKAGKDHCEAYDICSNLKYSKQHLRKRIKYYKDNKYPCNKSVVKYTNE